VPGTTDYLIDLHRHLEGSIRPSTALELGFPRAADDRDWRERIAAGAADDGPLPYLARVETLTRRITTFEGWGRVTREAIADAYDDGLHGVEFRFSPGFIAAKTGLPAGGVLEVVSDAATTHGLPIDVGLIGIVVRDAGPEAGTRHMGLFTRWSSALVGVDLAGDEAGFPARDFAPAFRRAEAAGLAITVHAGEAAGPESVWNAINHLGPQRIGHGVRSIEDLRLVEQLAARSITLEVAPTSNLQTRAVPSIAAHPLPSLLAAGVLVAVCTDNPTTSATTLRQEHRLAETLVSADDLARIKENARRASFLGSAVPASPRSGPSAAQIRRCQMTSPCGHS